MMADLVIKATALLAAGCLAAFVLRGRAASTRHAMWAGLMSAALLLPLIAALVPAIELPLLPAAAPRQALVQPLASGPSVVRDAPLAIDDAVDVRPPASSSLPSVTTTQIILGVWLAVAMLLIVRLASAHLQARGLLRACTQASDRLQDAMALVAQSLGVSAPDVRLAPPGMMPAVVGVTRPAVVLPADAEGWSDERLGLVLLHECAHVRRRDALMQVISSLATAAYWWHPLAWVAARHLVRERELACDDLVIASGTPASRYAEHLLDIARSLKASRQPALAALAMARPSQLEGRLIALLDERPRGARPSRSLAAGLILACAAVLLVAPIKLVARAVIVGPGVEDLGVKDRSLPTADGDVPLSSVQPNAQPQAHAEPQAQAQANPQPTPTAASTALSDALVKALKDEDADVRAAAMSVLLHDELPRLSEILTSVIDEALRDVSEDVRALAVAGLRKVDHPRKRALLLKAAADASEDVRALAAMGLADEASAEVSAALAKLAADDSEDVRTAAVMALGSIGDESAIPVLTTAMNDVVADVREAALTALASIARKRQ